MFAKVFEQIYDSSIAENYLTRLVFEDMLTLADINGVVDKTHEAISRRTNVPIDVVKKGIVELEKPDGRSRRPDEDGRRIVRLDDHRDWGWLIVNYEYYRKIASEDQRREKTRSRVQKFREKLLAPPLQSPFKKEEEGNRDGEVEGESLRNVTGALHRSSTTPPGISKLVDEIKDCRPEFRVLNRMAIENEIKAVPIEDARRAVTDFCKNTINAIAVPNMPLKLLSGYLRKAYDGARPRKPRSKLT